jgi:hypothetical protein
MPEKGGLSPPNANRSKAVARPTARSRVSNGKDMLLEGVDGRSVLARRYRNILAQLVSDLGGDPSEAQSIIARRATTLAVWCEQTEAKAAAGEVLNVTEFTRHECPSPPSQ